MARGILKRKLKILNLKKLKTTQHRSTSLGQWALKQLSKKQSFFLSTPYPKHLSLNLQLHRQQLLSQLVGGFSHLAVADLSSFSKTAGGFCASPKKDGLFLADSKEPSSRHTAYQPPLSCVPLREPNGQPGTDSKLPFSGFWPAYTLSCKSIFSKTGISTSNWKGIYSLDQLMCHQYDSQRQFTRRFSKLKLSLVENQKVAAVYGKLPRKQLIRLLQKANSHRAEQVAQLFESRLDVALKRCFVFNTLRSAQHWINQGRILVNHKKITSPSYVLQAGDLLSIGQENKERYISQFLSYFYKLPKEGKFVGGPKLLSRWKEWASLYNYLASHHQFKATMREPCKTGLTLNRVQAKVASANRQRAASPGQSVKAHHRAGRVSSALQPRRVDSSWPDKAIRAFWYSSGRQPWKCLYKGNQFTWLTSQNTRRADNLLHWLGGQRWLRLRLKWLRFRHWKDVYRRRILVFSRWLLQAKPLTLDGLYSLRWGRAFIRKKSTWIKGSHRQLALQKALNFEVSYKKLCAIYLYPPQRIALPLMIDFRRV